MFLGVSVLSGHHQVPIFIGLAMAGVWLYHLARQRTSRQIRTALGCIALFGIFAALASGLQTLPAIEYGRLSLRWAGALHPLGWNEAIPYRVHAEFSMAPDLLLGALLTTGTGPCMGLVALTMALSPSHAAGRSKWCVCSARSRFWHFCLRWAKTRYLRTYLRPDARR